MKARFGEHRVGDTYWFVGRDNARSQHKVTVTKVGRKYLTLNDGYYRVEIGTNEVVDTIGVIGYLYEDQAFYQEELARCDAWFKLRRFFERNWKQPENLSYQQMEEIAKIVGFDFAEGA